MKHLLLLSILFLTLSPLTAQNYSSWLDVHYLGGAVMLHGKGMEGLREKPVQGLEAEWNWHTNGRFIWQKMLNYPQIGLGVHYDWLGNPGVLGRAGALYCYSNFPFYRNGPGTVHLRIGNGLAWVDKVFHAETNSENIAIGAHWNYMFQLGLRYEHALSQQFHLLAGVGMTHYSNGAIRYPNKGLNQMNLYFGGQYCIVDAPARWQKEKLDAGWEKSNEWSINLNMGGVDLKAENNSGVGNLYFCSSMSLAWSRRYAYARKMGISLDAFYNESFYWHYHIYLDRIIRQRDEFSEVLQVGVAFNHEFMLNRLSILIHGGFYFYHYPTPDEYLYARAGLRYYAFDHVFLNFSLKAYGFKAQFIELGLGYSVNSLFDS